MRRFLILALALVAVPVCAETPDQVAVRYKLAGEVLIAKGGKVTLNRGYGTIDPAGGAAHKPGERWRLASITKQVTAALVVKGLADNPQTGPLAPALDAIYLMPALVNHNLGALTLRQVLTHHSGLANTNDTPVGADGVPRAYKAASPDYGQCVSKPAAPGAAFSYNNCDYIVLGAVLLGNDLFNGDNPTATIWPKGMAMAKRGEIGVPGFVGGKPEPGFELAAWGAAGGLMGTARSVHAFDRSLMAGKLLSPPALAELWKPEGKGSYQALGQWVFPGTLKGCAKPKRIVQRDGEIYGVQARNYIFPDDDLVVIVFTNRSSDDFALGEVWEGKGFTYDLLSAVACP